MAQPPPPLVAPAPAVPDVPVVDAPDVAGTPVAEIAIDPGPVPGEGSGVPAPAVGLLGVANLWLGRWAARVWRRTRAGANARPR